MELLNNLSPLIGVFSAAVGITAFIVAIVASFIYYVSDNETPKYVIVFGIIIGFAAFAIAYIVAPDLFTSPACECLNRY